MTPTEERKELIKLAFMLAGSNCSHHDCRACYAVRRLRFIGIPYQKPDMCTYEQFEAWEKSK